MNGRGMNDSFCPSAVATACAPSECRRQCASEVIDHLLCHPGAASGEETDLLLELRSHLRRLEDPGEVLRLFCELRRRMEAHHYLAFFRLRRWLENHLVAAVSPCQAAAPIEVPVRLDHYCVEAIRRACLCASLGRGGVLLAPRIRLAFRNPMEPAVQPPPAASSHEPPVLPFPAQAPQPM
jgi:hypothetical protein